MPAGHIARAVNTVVRAGETIAGKYRVDRVIGVGGMGVVMAAHHLELDTRVAIKFLLPETAASSEAVERFAREARAAVRIKNEHVARIADVGKLDDGTPYMVMEYLEGSDLAAWLIQYGPLSPEQAVDFVLQAGEAIAEAHSLGIVHRDLKPSNLFVTRRPDGTQSIKVLDFGISKSVQLGRSGASVTRTSVMVGSPMYMSPQQIRSARDVDAQGDIWALGVILYELISGVPPFDGENLAELVDRIMSNTPVSLQQFRPDVPPALEQVIFRCLARDTAQRFASIAALAEALLPFAPLRARASVERISGIRRTPYSTSAPAQVVTTPSFAPSSALNVANAASFTPNSFTPSAVSFTPSAVPAPVLAPLPAPSLVSPPFLAPVSVAGADREDPHASWRQMPPRRSRAPLFLGAALALVAGLALVVALRALRQKPLPTATAPAAPSAAPTTATTLATTPGATETPPAPAPAGSLVVTLGAAVPAHPTAVSTPASNARPRVPLAAPPPGKPTSAHSDPFDSNSWGRFRR